MKIGNISDRNGRALEYKIIDFLISNDSVFKIKLTPQALSDQKRDKQKYDSLPDELKSSYLRCAQIIHDWLLSIIPDRAIIVHKITDSQAKSGNVTDICIIGKKKEINLSIKHNHFALKHQRPPTTAKWCGYAEGSAEDLQFRKQYKVVVDKFLENAKRLSPNAKYFRDLNNLEETYIADKLYKPVCKLVSDTINNLCINKNNVESLFKFLAGDGDFYKIIDMPGEVLILNFNAVSLPESVQAITEKKNYVNLSFSNGWRLSMRLHTASSKLGRSLKFDTQARKLPDVPKISFTK
ncbi:MAG: HaeIII family restriction endonuclease [Candidatus Omnitrophica bacterium]|nr:HaeIII family restriction endonuclease [Candidatus Omnitrophota bacterium]